MALQVVGLCAGVVALGLLARFLQLWVLDRRDLRVFRKQCAEERWRREAVDLLRGMTEFYLDPVALGCWLIGRHRLLDGDAPAQRILDGRIKDVRALLAQLQDGAYV